MLSSIEISRNDQCRDNEAKCVLPLHPPQVDEWTSWKDLLAYSEMDSDRQWLLKEYTFDR
jgi:hypothetical protein